MSFSTATSKPTLPPLQLIVSQFVVGNFEKQLLLGHENPHARSRSSTNLLLNIPATTRSRQPSSGKPNNLNKQVKPCHQIYTNDDDDEEPQPDRQPQQQFYPKAMASLSNQTLWTDGIYANNSNLLWGISTAKKN